MEAGTIIDWITAHGAHGLALLVVAMLYLQGQALKEHRLALSAHFDEEKLTRAELIRQGTAITLLLERDRDRGVKDAVRDAISGVHEVPVIVDPMLATLATEDPTPVETPPPRPPRARSQPGTTYLVVADKKKGGA